MKSLYLNSLTQDYVNQSGSIANDNSLRTEAYVRLAAPRGNWLYGSSNFGSTLYSFMNKRQHLSKNALIQSIQQALAPILQNQRAQSITVNIQYVYAGQFSFEVVIVDTNGEAIHFTQKAVI